MSGESSVSKAAFRTLCDYFDENGWKYRKDEEELVIQCGVSGDDLPMEINLVLSHEKLFLLSRLPFTVPEEKRLEAAAAVSAVNQQMVMGCVDYNISDGTLGFRLSDCLTGNTISKDTAEELFGFFATFVDEFNDKFLMLIKGIISLEQFLQD